MHPCKRCGAATMAKAMFCVDCDALPESDLREFRERSIRPCEAPAAVEPAEDEEGVAEWELIVYGAAVTGLVGPIVVGFLGFGTAGIVPGVFVTVAAAVGLLTISGGI